MRGDHSVALLLALLALSSKRKRTPVPAPTAPRSTSSQNTPATPTLPSIAPLPDEKSDDSDLLDNDVADEFDVLWARFALHPERDGPKLLEKDLQPHAPESRTLTDFEIWALEPYFPVASDLALVDVHNGLTPPAPPHVDPQHWQALFMNVAAKTDRDGGIWFPNKVRGLWTRRWLAVLAHEVTHRAQMRMGATDEEAVQAVHQHGYWDSPIEVQARWMQRVVLRDLVRRAYAFFGEVLP